jgi:hypothetical protein
MPCLFEFWTILMDAFDYIIAGVEGYMVPDWIVHAVQGLVG